MPFFTSLAQNVLQGCSALLGPGCATLWRAQTSGQSGASGLADLLEQYARTLAQNMKHTYLNPVGLVAPNIGQHLYTKITPCSFLLHFNSEKCWDETVIQ